MSIAIGILLLGLTVFIHELGHFIAAKISGIRVREFGFGFPIPGVPRFILGEFDGTEISINWIPLGGFVSFLRIDNAGTNEYHVAPWKARLIVTLGGVVGTMFAAWLGITCVFLSQGLGIQSPLQAIFTLFYVLAITPYYIFNSISAAGTEALGGPISIVKALGSGATVGLTTGKWTPLAGFFALLNIGLFWTNLFPMAPLDGHQFFMLMYEKIRGKKMNTSVENLITWIGVIIFVAIMVITSVGDIINPKDIGLPPN